jgi:glycine/D-amino acid oxidase-like deaminating enzyme
MDNDAGNDAPRRRLARVLVSPQRVVRTVVGLRPFRRSGFRVEAEPLGDTLLVHNYGHGGCGVTLSWGTARLAIDRIAESGRGGPVAVIGCGAVGLATARLLQTRGSEVTIHAGALPPETTSNVAGALWYPHLIVDQARRTAAFDAQFESAARFSHGYFQGLVGEDYGVCWRQQYFLSSAPVADSWDVAMLRDLFPESRALRPGEHPFGVPHVAVDRMLFIEPTVYLEALLRDFRLAGGRVRIQSFASPADIAALPERIVVNCTGLGARELFDDRELTPVKGQLSVLPPQPEVDYAWVNDEDLYMFPRRDGILLGGTHEPGVESLEPNRDAERRILEGHKAVVDAMVQLSQ